MTTPSAAPFPLFDPWVWRMAWRDSRRSRGRLLVFSTALSLGVAALVAIGSVGWNLQRAINDQARSLVGADLVIEGRHAPDDETIRFIGSLGAIATARETRLASMANFPRGNGARLIQVRAIEGDFPFYGGLEADPPGAVAAFRRGEGALVEPSLLLQYRQHLGDTIRIGGVNLPIIGTVTKLPGEANAFASIAPRVLIPRGKLAPVLTAHGSIVHYVSYLKLPPGVNAPELAAEHREEFHRRRLDTDTVEHRQRQMGRVFSDVNRFLSLVSFVALLLGGIGVASAIHAHIKPRTAGLAV